jgi:hypothetical protein
MEVHADAGRDEELVRDGVLIRLEPRVPCHAAATELVVPPSFGKFVENACSVSECWCELLGMPLAIVVAFRMRCYELQRLEPFKHNPHYPRRCCQQNDSLNHDLRTPEAPRVAFKVPR